ncbi:MAG: hypothetical protein QF805_11500, partial [Pirellulaceae bacterium]|nr:hypothetical protein [Pirellulaceae bacterium]
MATTTHPTTAPLSHDIRRVLSKLRWRIRFYVWLEGFLAIAVWVGLTFWLGLALDYLPVLMWANELPWGARAFGLGMVGAVSLWLVFRYILRRTFVPLRDRSMAVVLERRYGDLGDSLVTSVELSQRPTEADVEMLQNTNDVAAEGIRGVRIGEVFHFPPLVMKAAASVILLAPIGAFYAAAPDKFDVWVNRFYRLQEQSWPRNAHISVVGAEVHRDWSDHWSQRQPQQLRKFENGVLRVARGASMQLRVGADARAAVIPDYCTIVYRSSDRSRGRVNMQQVGSPRDGQQLYTFDAKPLKGVLNDIRFDVVGFDHRVRNYRIEVVESPAVVSTLLHCTYPKYLEDEETGAWTPRSVEYLSSGMQLPQGTEVRMEFRANKPITEAIVLRLEDNQVIEAEMLDDQSFQCRLKLDGQPLTLEVLLADHNNVLSEQPQRYLVGSVEDQPPKVNVRLRGIGSAVTPDVVIPIEGTIEDDYQV